jgi:Nuclease-related domain
MTDVAAKLTVNRWRRWGKDRLYVTTADGETTVGWWDLLTEEGHPETPEQMLALEAAVQAWKGENSSAQSPAIVAPEPEPQPVPRPWIDLATNRPGAEAREQAMAAREAAPVKTLLARALGVHTDERAWRIGADGEEKVAAQLAKVAKKDARWRFLHAIPVGDRGSDIDHLVIGPGGVFTVNAKHRPGAKIWVSGDTFTVNGHRQPYIRNSRQEADRAAKLLTEACGFPVYVEGLIVAVNADDVTVKKQPTGVQVLPRMHVAQWLLRHGDVLTGDALDVIFEAARRSTTWQA